MRAWIGAALAAFAAVGCHSLAQPPSSPPAPLGDSIAYYQRVGSKQCERGSRTPESFKRELEAAGIHGASVACGGDGRMYAQSCGAPDGRIFVVRLPPSQATAVERLGLKPLRELPEATAEACR